MPQHDEEHRCLNSATLGLSFFFCNLGITMKPKLDYLYISKGLSLTHSSRKAKGKIPNSDYS